MKVFYYTIDDMSLRRKGMFRKGWTIQHFDTLEEAIRSYREIPLSKDKRLGLTDSMHSFALLDGYMETVNNMTEGETGLDSIRVKAIFYVLYFGDEAPSSRAHQQFVDCFVTYEERTRTVTATDEEGNEVETEESYTAAIPITDLETVWANIQTATGLTVTEEHRSNADSIYNLVRYGSSTGTEDWIPGAEVPFLGADGFWRSTGPGISQKWMAPHRT